MLFKNYLLVYEKKKYYRQNMQEVKTFLKKYPEAIPYEHIKQAWVKIPTELL